MPEGLPGGMPGEIKGREMTKDGIIAALILPIVIAGVLIFMDITRHQVISAQAHAYNILMIVFFAGILFAIGIIIDIAATVIKGRGNEKDRRSKKIHSR